MRLQDALDRFVIQLEADGRSPHTIAQYRRHITLLGSWLALEGLCDDVDDLSHEVLARFLVAPQARTARLGGSKKATSMNALRSSLRAFFSYCRDAGWCRENPARLIRRARCGAPPPRGLSDQDRQRLLDELTVAQGAVARRDHMWIHLLLATGMRLSAALALTDADVDLERGEILVRHAKGDRVEIVFLGREIRDHLVGYLAERPAGPLFPGRDGRPISRRHAARRLAVWMGRGGCRGPRHPHILRSTFGQQLYSLCRDPFVVQAAMGHRSIISTLAYVRPTQHHLRTFIAS